MATYLLVQAFVCLARLSAASPTRHHLTRKRADFHLVSNHERTLFVASNGNQDLASCTAKINRRDQQAKKEAVGFIGHFAATADSNVPVQAMFEQAEAWLKKHGVTRVIAPYNGAAVLGAGLLSTAFDEEPIRDLQRRVGVSPLHQ